MDVTNNNKLETTANATLPFQEFFCYSRHVCSTRVLPSIFFCLSGAGSQGQQCEQRSPDSFLPSHHLQFIRGFLDPPRCIISPVCPTGSTPGHSPSRTYAEHFNHKASRRRPCQIAEPLQLALFGE